ncbi:diguanylate cyclase [Pseudothauera nasutitermitis]|uniref:Diguanylate cyclase n=1 Tax=Pseudothauera nasutitermitis TaxID=2565930 RepID=A0A4S4B588_9RHOO|nr:GGDEF domain-containing protein [Pseudothauera nasutitermitis]THF66966.1 diguanylate cyclase [Pseudothauera nasutitermitis]
MSRRKEKPGQQWKRPLLPDPSTQEHIARAIDQARDGVIITDAGGNILYVNPAVTQRTGYAHAELVGRNPRLLQSGKQGAGFYARLWNALRESGTWQGEIVNRHKNGHLTTEYLTISTVFDDDGAPSYYLGVFLDIAPLRQKQQQLELLAYTDPLTGLPNRVFLMERMRQTLALARRSGRQVAVCYVDLDGFKDINDRGGHHCGDHVLTVISRRLQHAVREGDTVARLGGDEFALLLTGLDGPEQIGPALQRIGAIIASPIDGLEDTHISASIGVTFYPTDPDSPDALLRHADQAMYQAKRARSAYCVFNASGAPG